MYIWSLHNLSLSLSLLYYIFIYLFIFWGGMVTGVALLSMGLNIQTVLAGLMMCAIGILVLLYAQYQFMRFV